MLRNSENPAPKAAINKCPTTPENTVGGITINPPIVLSDQDRQAFGAHARYNAAMIGLTYDEWQCRRKDDPTERDLLMAFDPEGERLQIARHRG